MSNGRPIPAKDKISEAARRIYAEPSNDDLEIDGAPKISRGVEANGTWVQAWVWVPDDEVETTP